MLRISEYAHVAVDGLRTVFGATTLETILLDAWTSDTLILCLVVRSSNGTIDTRRALHMSGSHTEMPVSAPVASVLCVAVTRATGGMRREAF